MPRNLPINIVGISKMQKCGLKYVIYILRIRVDFVPLWDKSFLYCSLRGMKLLFSHDFYVIYLDEFINPGWTLYGERYRILSCLKIFVNWTASSTFRVVPKFPIPMGDFTSGTVLKGYGQRWGSLNWLCNKVTDYLWISLVSRFICSDVNCKWRLNKHRR